MNAMKDLSPWSLIGFILALLLSIDDTEVQVPVKLQSPTGLSVTQVSETSVSLTWSKVEDALAYVIYVDGVPYEATPEPGITLTGLSRATSYHFTVTASRYDTSDISLPSEPVSAMTDGNNLLENGSFDEVSPESGLASGWSYDGYGMTLISDPVENGTYAHRIETDAMSKGRYTALYQRIQVTPGKAYVFEGKLLIKQIRGMRVQLFLDFFDSQDRWVGENSKSLSTPTDGEFVDMSAEGVIPQEAAYGFVLLKIQATEDAGSALLVADNLWFRYASMAFHDSMEPNNYMSDAIPVSHGSFTSYLSVSGDEDWYALESDRYSIYDLSLGIPGDLDADLEVRNAEGRILGLSNKGKGAQEKLTVSAVKGQRLFIRVTGAYAEDYNKEPYSLTVVQRDGTGDPSGSDWQIHFVAMEENGRLAFHIHGEGLQPRHTVYLDTDDSRSTGMLNTKWPEAGIDYKIDHNMLYRYDPAASGWSPVGYANAMLSSTMARLEIYMEDADILQVSKVRVGYEGGDGTLFPQTGQRLAKLESKSSTIAPSAFHPRETFGPINNPFMGWAPASRGGNYAQPFSLVTASVTWRDLEPRKGFLDWDGVDRKYDLSDWTSKGKRIVLRIISDLPTDNPLHKDIPDWLYDELVAKEGSAGAGTWYRGDSGSGFSPNYASEVMIREHKRMIAEVAKKWDLDPRIAFVQIGSLGHHGEFHSSLIQWFPPVSVTDQYVKHYTDAFKNKKMAMRKPFPLAAEARLGLYNDMFGEVGSTASWLKWIEQGWYGIRDYIPTTDNPDEWQRKSRMPEFWKFGYSGGEFSSNLPVREYVGNDRVLSSLDLLRKSHTSWLGATSLAGLRVGKGLTEWEQAHADQLLSTMGYRFVLESIRMESMDFQQGKVIYNMDWSNKGIAPFYYDWKLQLVLIDEQGRIVEATRSTVSTDLRDWVPGSRPLKAELVIPKDMAHGRYRLAVGVIDPDTGLPGLELAIRTERLEGWHLIMPFDW